MISFVGLNHNVIPRAHALLQKKNLSWLGMGWGLAFLLILIQAWER
jgi:Na+-transporting methylmalonyl-CoA/oxaloacetate decarboxylase gamma subunit